MTDAEEDRIRLIASEIVDEQLMRHLTLCPFAKNTVEARLRTAEIRFGTLLGFMMGSGILGGTAGALLARLIH